MTPPAASLDPPRAMVLVPDNRIDQFLARWVWVRHWRSGRWGLVCQIWGEKYLIYFPDLEVFEWRWASAFYRPPIRAV